MLDQKLFQIPENDEISGKKTTSTLITEDDRKEIDVKAFLS